MIISLATIDFGGGGGSSAKIQPKKQAEYTANGDYSITPDEGYDGLEGVDVTVAIPTEEVGLRYQDNGSYTAVPSTGKYFSQVNVEVDVPLQDNQTVDITKNGTYTINPDEGSKALKQATVNVKTPAIGDKKSITYSANGSYSISPDEGDGGIEGADVTVNVPEKNIQETKIVNQDVETSGLYVFQPDEGYDGMKTLRANLTIPSTPTQVLTIPDGTCFGYSKSFNKSNYDFSNVTDMSRMFSNLRLSGVLDLSDIDTSNVTNIENIFYGSINVSELNLNNWDLSNCSSLKKMFDRFSGTTIDITGWKLGSDNVSLYGLFYDCVNLTTITGIENLDTSGVTDMSGVFATCRKLTGTIDLTNWNFTKNKSFIGMFVSCRGLTQIDMSLSSLTTLIPPDDCSYINAFGNCTNLKKINIYSWNPASIDVMENMFNGCTSLEEVFIKPGKQDLYKSVLEASIPGTTWEYDSGTSIISKAS